MIQEKDETGATTDYTYDMFGNLIEVTDALGNTNQYKYDDNNRCTVKIDALGNSTTYAYDCMGNLTRIQYPDGSMETMRYEAGYRKEYTSRNGGTVSYCYDGNGNCTEIKNAMGEVVQFFYDALNRRIQVINPDGANIRYAYDSVGNITEVTDGRGNTTRYTYTPNGNLKSVMDALGHITNYTYDKMGHLVQVERTGEQQKTIQRTQYEWDVSGNVTKVINPLGDMERFDYDIGNHLIRKTDREGYQTKFTYHADGLLKDILYGDGTSVTYQYNALKQLEEVKDITGTIQIQRDVLGRVKAVTDADGNTTRYEWGSMNERTGLQYPDGSYAGYQYNSQGQLEVLHMEKGEITYTYDTVGRLQEKLFPNGVRTSYRYNPAGQIEAIRHVGENVEENYRYQYDAAGNKTDIWKQRSQLEQGSGHYTYEYDALNQLVGVWKDGQQLRNYTYDSFGNRSQMDNYEQHTNTIYQYNENNQLLISETNSIKQNYYYDKRGNLTTVFQGEEILKQFQFNAANQMISSYESADGKYASYQYNALGKRIGQKVYRMEEPGNLYEDVLPSNPEKDIQYTLDITRPYYDLLGYKDKSNYREQSFYWDANVVSMKEEGEDIYYLQDDLGSPIHLLDAEGRSKATYGYEEFGKIRQFIGNDGFQPFGYTGYQKEEAGGLYYAQARRYDASVGRFVSEDKVKGFAAMPVSLNSYGYCWGNPMVYVDMDGRFPGMVMPTCSPMMKGNISLLANANSNDFIDEITKYVGTTTNTEGRVDLKNVLVGAYHKTVVSDSCGGDLINITITNGIPVGYSLNYSLNKFGLRENRNISTNLSNGVSIGGGLEWTNKKGDITNINYSFGMLGVELEWGSGNKDNIKGNGIKLNLNPIPTESFVIYGFSDDIKGKSKIRNENGIYLNSALVMLTVMVEVYIMALAGMEMAVAGLGLVTGISKIFDEMNKKECEEA